MQSIHGCVLVAFYLEKIKMVGFDIMSKKRKRLMGIVGAIICILLVGIGITIICVAKYKEEHRYLTYEELGPEQIVLIQETIGDIEGMRQVQVRAVDETGAVYMIIVPYKEWNGVEVAFNDICNGKKTLNRLSGEEMRQIYGAILEINPVNTYECIMNVSLGVEPGYTTERYFYGIRYKVNGEKEYIEFWKEYRGEEEYILDDDSAREIYIITGKYL